MYFYPPYYSYMRSIHPMYNGTNFYRSFNFATAPRWKEYENWMRDSSEAIKKIPLKNLALPGTHDSGTYELYTNEIYNVDDFTGIAPGIAGPIIRAMAVTQDADVYTQLMEGNRYIDLRFAKDQLGRIRIVHTVFGNEAINILNQIGRFLDEHPREVVIVDVQNINNLNWQDQIGLYNMIYQTMGKHLAPRADFSMGSTLSDFQTKEKNAILLYANKDFADLQPLYWYRDDSTIRNPWYNTNNYDYLMSNIDEALKKLPKERSYAYVSQMVLTVNSSQVGDIILNLLKWLPIPFYGPVRFSTEFNKLVNSPGIYNLTAPHFPAMQQWLIDHSPTENKTKPGRVSYYPNIIMRDFYQKDGIGTLIRYNISY